MSQPPYENEYQPDVEEIEEDEPESHPFFLVFRGLLWGHAPFSFSSADAAADLLSIANAFAGHFLGAHQAEPGATTPLNTTAYLDPHEKAITFQALRRCLESVGPRGLSGESGGSEGLASATTDNRPMSIDVYRAPAPGPSAPKPPGQPAIGGRLV